MMTVREKHLALAMCAGTLVMFLDQASKKWILLQNAAGNLPQAWSSFLNIILVWNEGISFGMFKSNSVYGPMLLKCVAFVLMFVLLRWLWVATNRQQALALGLVLGGAIGNVIDRFNYGAVVDFIDAYVGGYHWPAFNVADSAICIGVVLLILETILPKPMAVEASPDYLAPPKKQDRFYS